ncbi:MAG: hypothetical protein ACEPOZ_09480 [Marinifilaceae bacterium]
MTQSDNQLSGKTNLPSNKQEVEGNLSASSFSEDKVIREENPEIKNIKEKLARLDIALNSAQNSRLMLIQMKQKQKKLSKKKKKKCRKSKLRKELRRALQQNILLCQEIIQIKTDEIECWRRQLEESLNNSK